MARLRWKIAVRIVGAAALTVSVVIIAFNFRVRQLLRNELELRSSGAAASVAQQLSLVPPGAAQLQALAGAIGGSLPDAGYLVLRDASGEALAVWASPALGSEFLERLRQQAVPFRGAVREVEAGGRSVLEKWTAVDGAAPGAAGEVQLGLLMEPQRKQVLRLTLIATMLGLLLVLGSGAAAFPLARSVSMPVEHLSAAAGEIAKGREVALPRGSGIAEIELLVDALDSMGKSVHGMLADLRDAAQAMQREAQSMLSTSGQQASMAGQQAAAMSQTSSTAAEIAITARAAAEQAETVVHEAATAQTLSTGGQDGARQALSGMSALSDQVRAIARSLTELSEKMLRIGQFVAAVDDIAEQSNLLALNAAVEASRAGSEGRGFGVVAAEMRALASQSKKAAQEVRGLLGQLQQGMRSAVRATEEGSRRAIEARQLAEKAGEAILGISEFMGRSAGTAQQIAGTARQQTVGVEQIVSAIQELSSASTEVLEGSRRIETSAGALNALARRLAESVGRFEA